MSSSCQDVTDKTPASPQAMHFSFSFRNVSCTDSTLAASGGCDDLEGSESGATMSRCDSATTTSSRCGGVGTDYSGNYTSSSSMSCHVSSSSLRSCVKSCGLLLSLAAMLSALIAVLIFIGVPVAMSGQHNYVSMKNLSKNESFQMTDLSPLVVSDLSLGERNRGDDAEGRYHLYLYDAVGFHEVDVVQRQQQWGTNETAQTGGNTTSSPAAATSSYNPWYAVQPTGDSLVLMDRLPHIRTGPEAFLEVNPTFDLRSDRNWTLSFAGARLQQSSSSSSIRGCNNNDNGDSPDIILSSSLFPSCRIQYESDNTLGMYLTTIQSGRADTTYYGGIVLPYNVYELHVLTWTYCQESQLVEVYQNEDLVATIRFEDGWVAFNRIGGSAGGVAEGDNEDHTTTTTTTTTTMTTSSGSSGSSSNPSCGSNLAITRMSYFHDSFQGDDLAELALYMRW